MHPPSPPDRPADVTLLLEQLQAGNSTAWEKLLARVGDELRMLAHRQMAQEKTGHVLQTTALVNEAFLRMVGVEDARFENRAHFFTVAATAMRRILVDEARRRNAQKRGGGQLPVTISQLAELAGTPSSSSKRFDDLEAVNSALARLEADLRHRKKSKIVELRFFVGLTLEQTAEVLGVSLATVKRDWEFARAWLRRELDRMAAEG